MTPTLLLALAAFALVSSITPGPNNLMLMASGINFGFRPTIPHMLGVAIGFSVMIVAVGAGVATVLSVVPGLLGVIKWLSVAYLLYLAWKDGHLVRYDLRDPDVPRIAEEVELTAGNSKLTALGFLI